MRSLALVVATTAVLAAHPALAQDIAYGDDASEWANDGECDDRRFGGSAMSAVLLLENVGHDATDCRNLVDSGAIQPWVMAPSLAATQCDAIEFGDDSGTFSGDAECDDIRFEGIGMASQLSREFLSMDATDCRAQCDFGTIGLREY